MATGEETQHTISSKAFREPLAEAQILRAKLDALLLAAENLLSAFNIDDATKTAEPWAAPNFLYDDLMRLGAAIDNATPDSRS